MVGVPPADGAPLPVSGLPAGTAVPPVVPAAGGVTPHPVATPALPFGMGGPLPAPVGGVTPLPVLVPVLPTGVGGPVPVPSGMGGPVPAPVPSASAPAPATALIRQADPFKLPPIADTKSFINLSNIINYYLRRPEFSTQRADGLLITDSRNAEASCFWEGQIRVAVQDGSLRFLFENKGSLFDGKGFEMLAELNKHCRPDSVANAFTSLMSLFNDKMTDAEDILAFRSRFDGLVNDMSRSKIVIPQMLMVMIFLRSLHSRYEPLLDQFRSRIKLLEDASVDSIVSDVRFHDEFKTVGSDKKPGGRAPRAAAAATSPASSGSADAQGKVWNNPWEWLAKINADSVKKRWKRSLAGHGFCPICHREEDKHSPAACPLLATLNLKLITVSPQATAPAPTAGSPSPGGRSAAVGEDVSGTGSVGSGTPTPAPSGLMATVAEDEYDSGDDFRWDGDECGAMFVSSSGARKSNSTVALYPTCNHASVVPFVAPSLGRPSLASATSTRSIPLSKHLSSLITTMAARSIMPGRGSKFTVADSGATDHMFPDKGAFISYKAVTNLQVRMGNNSYLPVLGRGSAVISLNGQRILVRNVLHVPGLVVPLYSLRAHCTQRGCGFIGASDVGILVYFPTFVLSVDTSRDCHLAFESLGRSGNLDTLDYVQPRCEPTVYPSELSSSSTSQVRPAPAVVEDDSDPDVTWSYPQPKVPTPMPTTVDMSTVSQQLESLSQAIASLQARAPSPAASPLPAAASSPPSLLPSSPPSDSGEPPSSTLISTMSREEVLALVHKDGTTLPAVRPCDTANSCDTKSHWTGEELHRVMGCRKFRNYKQLLQVSRGGEWVEGGEFPPSIGSFATIPKSRRGKSLDRTVYKYLDAVHMDIAFGDCLSVGGFRYALILVDRATRYNWVFGLHALRSECIIGALRLFRAAAGGLARCFYSDCDAKLFGTAVAEYLVDRNSKVVAAPAKRQSSNGLVESHWKTMVHMARAYLTEKQMPRTYWYYAVVHAARMMNAIPGKYNNRFLASPFLLVHGVGHDERTWIPLFSLCYFHHEKDGDDSRSKHMAHTLDGIIVGRSETSNALLVYNPRNGKYYEPDSFRIDSYRLPCSVYPTVKYDGGLFVSLVRDDLPMFEEKYPPGTRVERLDPSSNMLLAGTVMDIPLPGAPLEDASAPTYLIVFDNGSHAAIPLDEMASLIPPPPVDVGSSDSSDSLLPPFLRINSKITYEHDGQYHKGFLGKRDGCYRFIFKSHVNKRKEDWSVPLPNLVTSWVDMCVEGILLPGHVSHTFIRTSVTTTPATFDPVASFVSALNLHRDCPPTLLRALADSHPDREVWLESYREEKGGLQSLETYKKITLGEYRALREKGAPKAIPTMCVLTIKRDENLLPHRAKSRIVVLGNHEDRIWAKSEKFAPVLRSESLRLLVSMAVEKRRPLRQGDCKNAFCQGILPANEITIVRPPPGDPEAEPGEYWLLLRTLYGLRRSPRHWYDKINAILRSIGLTPSLEDPCLYSGFITDPSDPSQLKSEYPLSLGIYVDDFVYFSEDPAVEDLFCRLLAQRCKVDFMGIVNWFLGIHFSWRITPSSTTVHLSQAGFATNLVESFSLQDRNQTPTATPYRSGVPIDSIAESSEDVESPALKRRKEAYQSLVGSIGWLAHSTRPDLITAHSFLAAYSNKPSTGHMKAALYALHYIHSTHDYGISFTSDDLAPMHSYIHYPPSTDVEAYRDALPPTITNSSSLSSYSDACWGSQIGSAVADGTLLPLFKFRSMSGGIVFKNGGPLGWLSERQERTSLSSCEAEIRATSATSKKVVDFRNICRSVTDSGFPIPDIDHPTLLYNDNEACVKWSHNMTSKGARHIELRENSVREWVQDKTIKVKHVPGKTNPADIFTKEMRDGVHFRRLRDSFMSRLADFSNTSTLLLHHGRQRSPNTVTPSAAWVSLALGASSYFSALAANTFCRSASAVSHLSSAGRQLLRGLHGFIPPDIF